LLDRELYLPLSWFEKQERCQEAGIPNEVRFQTKPELARIMIERLSHAQVPVAWVVADTVYGGNLDLRTWLEAHGYSYVLAVPSTEAVGLQMPSGRRRCMVSEALSSHTDQWQRISMSEGTKGPRLFEWTMIPMLHRWKDDERHFLLIRRSLDDPGDKAYYFVFAPPGTSLPDMVRAIGQRWHIEECFEAAKSIGLEDYEVRCYKAWYRYTLLVMLVQACLAGICSQMRKYQVTAFQVPSKPSRLPLLPLTIPEVRHLLAHLLWPLPRSTPLVLSRGAGGGAAIKAGRVSSIRNVA
jgi:SRSO17 transposase